MKTLHAYAILSKQDNHLMYFTDNKDQLNKTEWLQSNASILPVTLYKDVSGLIAYTLPGYSMDVIHSESIIFYNLPESFTRDIYHHKHFDHYNVTKKLLDILPHGSGINGNWHIDYLKNGKIQAHNFYEGMNESGMYCHTADFTVTLHINHLFQFTFDNLHLTHGSREYTCCLYDIKSYLSDLIAECLHDERMKDNE